ncbi:MFS transporter [Microbacterium amylolyticum]|uniref:MFS family permease n=1 Tax=Microbacterium amylolyticum TaxID=936337 RepID=A0ABS4ZH79_9MICO|nr:MFS transporter [Microbacterium amylolyticum]MBP2436633.1 MFS family permease [Microbacterium amylolyticum]
MFRSLKLFNFRIWFLGALVSNVGAWMQATAQDWVVLTELTDHDATAVGLTMAFQFGPPLVLVGVTGWVADRFDRRTLLLITQSVLGLISVAIGVLLILDVMTLPIMYAFAIAFGVANAFDSPARQAFVSDIVGRSQASNAVALNSASFNMARLIGPAAGAILLIAVGSGWVFVINAVTFLAMIAALAFLRTDELQPRVLQAKGGGRLIDGFRYVTGRKDLVIAFIMAFLMGAFGLNFPIFSSTMAIEFGRDADGYGLLSSSLALGSLAGALLAARRDRARLRVVMLASACFGVSLLVASQMPGYWAYAAVCIVIGFTSVTMLTTTNGYVQTTTDPALRGRVLALYLAVIMGATPVGAPLVGAISDAWGPRVALLFGAGAGLVAAAIGAGWLLFSGRVRRAEAFRITIDETRPITIVNEVIPEQFSDQGAQTTPIRAVLEEDRKRP